MAFKKKAKEPIIGRLDEIKRRWWQKRKVRLVCSSCDWKSEQTWLLNPRGEFYHTDKVVQQIVFETHLLRRHFND